MQTVLLLLAAALAAGCGNSASSDPQSAGGSGSNSGGETSHPNAGAPDDAGGMANAMAGVDSGGAASVPAGIEPQALNGCNANGYEDHGAEDDERVIQIAAEGLKFTPPCLAIAVGQSVKFEGSLSAHPLSPGNANHPDAGSPNSPIRETTSGMSVEFTFDAPGTYPYFCELHGFGDGQGMSGAVFVHE
jgi:plastocyanin